MIVGIIGSGGREHAICCSLNTAKIKKIYCFPGNAGTSNIAENISLNLENFVELKDFIILNKIDLIVIGPEKPLVDGLVDFLEKYDIKVLAQIKLRLSSKVLKFLPKTYVTNIIFPQQNMVFFKTLMMQVNL